MHFCSSHVHLKLSFNKLNQQALQKQIPTNPNVRKIKHIKSNLQKSGETVKLCWIPGQAGISGNKIADKKKTDEQQDGKNKKKW